MGKYEEETAVLENRDPISGAKGAHPVGVGIGAASAAATGAVIGSIAGPIGTAVGAAVGGVVGGLIGKGVAEFIDPTVEDAYWRGNYNTRPYATPGTTYDAFQPAYRYGWESYKNHAGRKWDDIEPELRTGWDNYRGRSSLAWDKARDATRDAWNRVERTVPTNAI